MKKIVVFTEGRGELIFIRHLLIQIVGYEHLSFQCFDLISDTYRKVSYTLDNPNALIYFEIINVGTDTRVLSSITKYHNRYIELGYDIIGLRDMYSEEYKKKSGVINQDVSSYFQDLVKDYLNKLNNPERIHFFFAVMELEAWFLGLYKILERVNPLLNVENIRVQLGFDLEAVDPETNFFHPAIKFAQVLNLANINYDKHTGEVESFVSRILLNDIHDFVSADCCNSFVLLFSEIQRQYDEVSG